MRKLKGLESIIGVSVVHWHMGEGGGSPPLSYSTTPLTPPARTGWRFATPDEASASPEITTQPEELPSAHYLRDLYFAANGAYEGRYTVPVLWDTKHKTICNNESSEIIRFLYTEFDDHVDTAHQGVTYYPAGLADTIDTINTWAYVCTPPCICAT